MSEPLILTWWTSPDERVRHDQRFRYEMGWEHRGNAQTCVCGDCGATYVTDGASDGPEDLFTHMVRRHVGLSAGHCDVIIRKIERPNPKGPS